MMEKNHTCKLELDSNLRAKDFPGGTAPAICDAHSFFPLCTEEIPVSRIVLSTH